MNILHTVEFYAPHVGGAEEVVRQVSERLAARGHTVTVATRTLPEREYRSLNGVAIESFDVSGSATRGIVGEGDRYQTFLRDARIDVMLNSAAQQWASDLAFPLLPDLPYARAFVPCGFSGLYRPEYAAYYAPMPDTLRHYDELIFHADQYRDTAFAREHGLARRTVIPNGASEREFTASAASAFRAQYGIAADVPLLLTVGNHTGQKGHALAIEAFRRARIGEAVLVVIGGTIEGSGAGCSRRCRFQAETTRWRSGGKKRVLLLNPPRADVVAAFQAADLFVFGSNVEYSPLVLYEAVAAKTPFISVACGNAEEIAAWTGGGIVIPTQPRPHGYVTAKPADMAAAIESLIGDSGRRAALAEAGHRAWRERFTWDAIVDLYEEAYRRAIERRAS